jgi:hypothetical protein
MPPATVPESPRSHPATRSPAGVAAACVFLILATFNPTGAQTTQPAADPAPALAEVGTRLSALADSAADPATRRQAALALLNLGTQPAVAALLAQFDKPADPGAALAVAQAVVLSPRLPPRQLAHPLLEALASAGDAGATDLAAAAARFPDPATADSLAAIACDGRAALPARQAVIATLAQARTQAAAGTLIALLDDSQPAAVRAAAAAALAQMTGLTQPQTAESWRRWWHENDRVPEHLFLERIIANHAAAGLPWQRQSQQLQDRLVEALRQNYRLTPAAQQEAFLAVLLADPLEALKLTAEDLTEQRLRDQGPVSIGTKLTDAVRARLDDSAPAVVQRAVGILTELNDKPAADAVAAALARNGPRPPALTTAYLHMMAGLPRAAAVVPAIAALADPTFTHDAAAALAAAADAHLLNGAQTQQVLGAIRGPLQGAATPDPMLVTLLGAIGQDQDWQTVRNWLDSKSEAVRRAAARAWARSDRSLMPLVERSADTVILPILLAAAADPALHRQAEPPVFDALVNLTVGQDLADSWRQAVTFMAGQVSPPAVLAAAGRLEQRGHPIAFRVQVLSAAIEKLLPPARPDAPASAALADLLLARAAIHLADHDPKLCRADAERLDSLKPTLTAGQRSLHDGLLIQARLASNEMEGLFDFADTAIQADDTAGAHTARTTAILTMFVDAALTCNRPAQAQAILDWLDAKHNQDPVLLESPLKQRVAAIAELPGVVRHPAPAATQPTSAPATQPAAPATRPVPAPATTPAKTSS